MSPTHRLRILATSVAATAALAAPLVIGAVPANAATGDDWLHVSGNKIVDESGKEVLLTGTNWFGFNASERVFHGLWSANITTHHQEHGRPRHQHRPRADLHPAAARVEGGDVPQAERQHVRQPRARGQEQPADLRLLADPLREVRHQGLPRRAQRGGRQLRPRLPGVVEGLDHHRGRLRRLGVGGRRGTRTTTRSSARTSRTSRTGRRAPPSAPSGTARRTRTTSSTSPRRPAARSWPSTRTG